MNSRRHSPCHSAQSFRYGVALVGVLLLLGGCAKKESSSQPQSEPPSSTSSNSASPSSQTAGPATRGLTEAEIRYGVSPTRNDSHFVYEDNVVIVEHGAETIRSLSTNGLSWTIDANAPHADEIKPGKIAFLTSRAVGRVLSAERKGNDLAVIFGPVELTDVFKEAHVPINEPIDLDSMITSSAPDYPGTDALPETSQLVAPPYGWSTGMTGRIPIYGDQPWRLSPRPVDFSASVLATSGSANNRPDGSHLTVAVFPLRRAADLVAFAQDPSPQAKPREIEVKDLKLTPFCCGGLGMRASYLKNGLQFNAEAVLQLEKPAVVGRLEKPLRHGGGMAVAECLHQTDVFRILGSANFAPQDQELTVGVGEGFFERIGTDPLAYLMNRLQPVCWVVRNFRLAVIQTFTPSLRRLTSVEVELVVANPGPASSEVTMALGNAEGQELAVIWKNVAVTDCHHVLFVLPKGGLRVTPGQTYSITLSSVDTVFGWKYVVGGYTSGAAMFNGFPGKPLSRDARTTFLFRTFGAN
jgi:hypothetical protein